MGNGYIFSSPWVSSPSYWLVVASQGLGADTVKALKSQRMKPVDGAHDYFMLKQDSAWLKSWQDLSKLLIEADEGGKAKAAIIPSEAEPSAAEINFHLKPWREVDTIAQHVWLLDALASDRLVCFMQHAVDKRGKRVGYEAFARIEQADGGVIGGGIIMAAARALGVEYQLDRLMHRQAIANFVEGDLDGYLFINFLTGFIHRPEIYLEGLSHAVGKFNLLPRKVVLDVPLPDYARDESKLRTIVEYCRQRGFGIALDDVMTPVGLESMLKQVQPAFVKLDSKMGQKMTDFRKAQLLEIVRLSHEGGAMVLAEGVETEELHQLYQNSGCDLFQGYLFGAPERCIARKSA